MKLTNRTKIEVLLDKINLLFANMNEDVPEVEVQLLKKYVDDLNNQLSDLISQSKGEIIIANKSAKIDIAPEVPVSKDKILPEEKEEEETPGTPEKAPQEPEQPPIPEKPSIIFEPMERNDEKMEEEVVEEAQEEPMKPAPERKEGKVADKILDFLKKDKRTETKEEKPVEKPEERSPEKKEARTEENPQSVVIPVTKKEEVKQQIEILTRYQSSNGNEDPKSISLNERFKGSDNILMERLKNNPIKDLKTDIGLNDKFWYSEKLFNGDLEYFKTVLNELNHLNSYDEAMAYVEKNLRNKYNWDEKAIAAERFISLLRRRYL